MKCLLNRTVTDYNSHNFHSIGLNGIHLNAAARLTMNISKYSHITPVFQDLHWLPVHVRINFTTLILVFKVIHGLEPPYISDLISVRPKSSYNLRSNSSLTGAAYRENAIYAWHQTLLCRCTMFVK